MRLYHRHLERARVRSRVRDGRVGMIEVETGDVVLIELQQPCADQRDQPDALARALRLSKAEHAHLEALARNGEHRAFAIEAVPELIQRLLKTLKQPAYVTGRRWDLLAWNAVADDVFAFSRLPDDERNILLCMFTNRQTRILFGEGWAEEARRMVAQFRATHTCGPAIRPSPRCSIG